MGKGKPVQITWAQRPGKGPRPRLCRKSFGLSGYYNLLILQFNHFRSSPSHSANKSQSFRFGVNLFSRVAHAWGSQNLFFTGVRTLSWRSFTQLLSVVSEICGRIWNFAVMSAFFPLPKQGAQKRKNYDYR